MYYQNYEDLWIDLNDLLENYSNKIITSMHRFYNFLKNNAFLD